MLGDEANFEIKQESLLNEEEDLEYSPMASSSSDDEDDQLEEVSEEEEVDEEEVAQINFERAALESREIPKTRGTLPKLIYIGGKLFSGHRFNQQEYPSDEEDEDFAPEESDSEDDLEDENEDEMEQEVIDNVQNVHQVYKKKELLVKDAKILRNRKEVLPLEGSDLSERMERLLNTAE